MWIMFTGPFITAGAVRNQLAGALSVLQLGIYAIYAFLAFLFCYLAGRVTLFCFGFNNFFISSLLLSS